jgi:membrane protein DedA with SNARE-associated domain
MTMRMLIRFFIHYKYEAIFPIAVLEGPIITIISGFLVYRGILSFVGAFLVVFFGDAISDTVFYLIGRGGKKYVHKLKFLHITDEHVARVEAQYERSPWKTMIVAKVSYGLGIPFMLATGLSKMSTERFLFFMGVLNAIRSLLLLSIGYYFGRLALRMGPTYIGYYTVGIIILVPCIYLIIKRKKTKSMQ